jgi:phosphatidylserine/phosphatidylglycerophosphate/cardiolipin synthase-like enzyme
MSIDLKVYDNGDHTCLVWLPSGPTPIPDCRGFVISRVKNGKQDYIHSAVGFTAADKLDAEPTIDKNKAIEFPIQRFMWWDYYVAPDDKVAYSVIPVVGKSKDALSLREDLGSPVTPQMQITGECSAHVSAYFNKGIVAAQWVARAVDKEPKTKKLKDIVATPKDPLREELSGLLRPRILDLLAKTKAANGKIYAALYELNDPELIPALVAFGQDCNLILANGAFKPPDNDENKAIRAQLKTKIRVYDRIVGSPHFGHNKFVVFCDSTGKPERVLTGSTNWTSSGLCTQANNGLIIDDPAVAQNFLDAWNRIHAAGNEYPATLAAANSSSTTFQVDGCKITPWFVPTSHAQDLDYARKLISNAKEGILFLFFNPGTFQPDSTPEKWTLLQNILNRHHQENNAYYDPNLYIKGVVNQEIPYLTEGPSAGKKPPSASMDPTAPSNSVALYNSGIEPPQRLTHDVLVPANIKDKSDAWEKELLGASMVNIHSKVIVLDPFGENPVVMTGSHNLGYKASSENDDNLVIIEGHAPLAAAYAVNIIAIFQNYRWNSHVEAFRKTPQDPKAWHGLQDTDQWQTGHLQGDALAELNFWFGKDEPAAIPAKAAAAAAGADGAAVSSPAPAPSQPHASHTGHTAHETHASHAPATHTGHAAASHTSHAAASHTTHATHAAPARHKIKAVSTRTVHAATHKPAHKTATTHRAPAGSHTTHSAASSKKKR